MKTVRKRNAQSLSDQPSPCEDVTAKRVRLLSREQVRSAEPAPVACVAAESDKSEMSCITCIPLGQSTTVNHKAFMRIGQIGPPIYGDG